MPTSDRFGQYAEDVPTFSQALSPYQWAQPSHWLRTGRSGGGRPILAGTGGIAGVPGRAGAAPAGKSFVSETGTDRFVRSWRESAARAERMRQQYEGTRRWSGSPQDYEDVVGPERSGGMEKVVNGPKQAGLRKNEGWGEGSSPVPATPMPTNGNGMSGAAKVPTGVGYL